MNLIELHQRIASLSELEDDIERLMNVPGARQIAGRCLGMFRRKTAFLSPESQAAEEILFWNNHALRTALIPQAVKYLTIMHSDAFHAPKFSGLGGGYDRLNPIYSESSAAK